MERENYYILLELPFESPENDETRIEAAIESKRQQWSKDANNPFKKDSARYLGMLEDIKSVMLNSKAREEEAAKAKSIKEKKAKALDDKLSLYSSKGSDLLPRDIKLLIKEFGAFGFDEKAINDRFEELSSDQHEEIGEVLDKDVAKNIQKFLQDLGSSDHSLYDFLGLNQSSSSQSLLVAADELRKKLLAKGEQTGSDAIKQQLSALCKTVFSSEKEKEKYDNYLRLTKYSEFNKLIDEAAQMNKRVIEPNMKTTLLSRALEKYSGKLELSQASVYLENYCEYMGYTLAGGTIICGSCGEENPAGSTVCRKCHKQLIINCPRCDARNDNITQFCVKCDFDLSKIEEVKALIHQAKQAISVKSYNEATDLIEKAKLDWSDHPDIAVMEKTIQRFKDGFDKALDEVNRAVEEQNYYTARTLIEKAENDGYEFSKNTKEKIELSIKEAESELNRISTMNAEESFALLQSLSSQINDSAELQRELRKHPPNAPSGFKAEISGSKATLTWQKSDSPGQIKYVLVRKEGAPPNSSDDGRIYEGSECSFTDDNVPASSKVYYSVYARRMGVDSVACKNDAPVVIVDSVKDVRVVGGDCKVDIAWKCSNSVSEVKVWIKKSTSQPTSSDFIEEVPCNRLDGLTIEGLENGDRYWIKIVAYHDIDGSSFPSETVTINAIPVKPVKPIEGFTIDYHDERFYASWEPAEWDVALFCSEKEPAYIPGTVLAIRDIQSQYKKIDAIMTDKCNAEFSFDFIGKSYIIPALINATNVVPGKPVCVSNVPKPEKIYYDFNQGASEMYVEFDWPEGIDDAMVLMRLDAYPDSPDDPIAVRAESNKIQYDSNAGIIIQNPPEGMLYTSVYTFLKNGSDTFYSQPENILINNEPQRNVLYSFNYKRPGLFSKASILTIDISSSGTFVLPQFIIVAKYSSIPLRRDDGDIICGVSEQTEIEGRKTFELDVPELKKGTRLKMFFLNDKHYKKYKIQNSGSSTI